MFSEVVRLVSVMFLFLWFWIICWMFSLVVWWVIMGVLWLVISVRVMLLVVSFLRLWLFRVLNILSVLLLGL